jgi:hypothetical protein
MSDRTVHGLLHGYPLCGFSSKVPRDWPPGHVWVIFMDIDDITCGPCKKKAEEISKEETAGKKKR